jgi:hypothetical protein
VAQTGGPEIAEQFSEWIATVPPEATLLLDPILASFRDGPVRATVKLEVEESGIDWFDLRVALDMPTHADQGGDQGAARRARRLCASRREGLAPPAVRSQREDQAQLADLGLSANDLDGGKQRLHALQLAGKSATKRLLNEEHTQRIERRAEEIRTRVAPAIPPALKAELRPLPGRGLPFSRVSQHQPFRRHSRRRHGSRQNAADPLVAALAARRRGRDRSETPAAAVARRLPQERRGQLA